MEGGRDEGELGNRKRRRRGEERGERRGEEIEQKENRRMRMNEGRGEADRRVPVQFEMEERRLNKASERGGPFNEKRTAKEEGAGSWKKEGERERKSQQGAPLVSAVLNRMLCSKYPPTITKVKSVLSYRGRDKG